jgi:hypothetical protein
VSVIVDGSLETVLLAGGRGGPPRVHPPVPDGSLCTVLNLPSRHAAEFA